MQDELATSQVDGSDEGTVEPGVPPAPTFFPSSFGFTCSVSAGAPRLEAEMDSAGEGPVVTQPARHLQSLMSAGVFVAVDRRNYRSD